MFRRRIKPFILSVLLVAWCSLAFGANEWTWNTNFVAISDVTADSTWRDADLSGSLPSGTKAVCIGIYNTSSTNYVAGVRPNGSSDNRYATVYGLRYAHVICKVDANRIVELYQAHADINFYIVGYSDCDFQLSADAAGSVGWNSWADKDITASISSSEKTSGAVVNITSNNIVRENGSTDNLISYRNGYNGVYSFSVGVDGDEVYEVWTAGGSCRISGWWEAEAEFATNVTNITPGTTGSYQDVDVSDYVSENATGVMCLIIQSPNPQRACVARKNGSTDDFYAYGDVGPDGRTFFYCGIDDNKILEIKTEGNCTVYLYGWTVSASAPATGGYIPSHTYEVGIGEGIFQ